MHSVCGIGVYLGTRQFFDKMEFQLKWDHTMWIKNPTPRTITLHSMDGDSMVIPAGVTQNIQDKFASAITGSGIRIVAAPSAVHTVVGPDPASNVTYGLLPEAIAKFLMDNPAVITEALSSSSTLLLKLLTTGGANSIFAQAILAVVPKLPKHVTFGRNTVWSNGGSIVVSNGNALTCSPISPLTVAALH